MNQLTLRTYILGDLETNVYLLVSGNEALLIDTPGGAEVIVDDLERDKLTLKGVVLTHAHFDHIIGMDALLARLPYLPEIYLNPIDQTLWDEHGLAPAFGLALRIEARISYTLHDGEVLTFDGHVLKVLHTPGHTPGHISLYAPEIKSVFCGDTLFYRGIGRSDLPYGNEEDLFRSIREKLFALPDDTIVYSGHGPATTIGDEKKFNPFMS